VVRKAAVALVVGIGLVILGSCGSNATTSGEGDLVGATTASDGASEGRFCAVFGTTASEVPESYVGSPEHLAAIDRLLDASPPAVAGDVETFRTYVASGSITDDPASKDNENFPPEVRRAIDDIRSYAASTC
jgi:hypothetical protein